MDVYETRSSFPLLDPEVSKGRLPCPAAVLVANVEGKPRNTGSLCQTTASPQSPPTQSPSRWLGGGDRNPLLECASLPHPSPLPKPEVIRLQHQGFHASLRHLCRMEHLRSSRQGREVKQVGHWPLCDFEHTAHYTGCCSLVKGGSYHMQLLCAWRECSTGPFIKTPCWHTVPTM